MELIKVWRKDGFTLRLFDTGKYHSRGTAMLAYTLKDKGTLIFEGDDFSSSPMHAIDSLETVTSLLGFLTLRPGDTDREYFDKYTPAQMAWCQSSRCELLGLIQYLMEERQNKRK